jgi:hypothetical protein
VTQVSDAAARLDRLPVSAFHRRTAALLAYVFFGLGDLNSSAYAAPALRQQWQLSIGTIATITSASFVGMFVGAMSAGTLSDHIGRKRTLLATTLWYSTMSRCSSRCSRGASRNHRDGSNGAAVWPKPSRGSRESSARSSRRPVLYPGRVQKDPPYNR